MKLQSRKTLGKMSALLICIAVICTPFGAYAMNPDYINRKGIWIENEDSVIHSAVQTIDGYTGFYRYVSDTENHCFYLHISYGESSLTGESTSSVNFNIKNNSREYHLSVDTHGIFNASNGAEAAFDIISEFGTVSNQGQEIYIALEFKDKTDKVLDNEISFSLSISGRTYTLCDGILLEYYTETTTKAVKTTTSTQKTDHSDNTKVTTEKSTKYKYTGSASEIQSNTQTSRNGYAYTTGEANEYEEIGELSEQSAPAEIIIEADRSAKLSPVSKALIASAAVMTVTAIALITNAVFHNRKSISTEDDENDENDS